MSLTTTVRDSGPHQTWSFIIFCRDEEGSLEAVVDAILEVASVVASKGYEVIIVDDGSEDASLAVAARLAERHPQVQSVSHKVCRGIGNALRTGYGLVRMENVCAIPGDGQFDVRELLSVGSIPMGTVVSFYREEHTGYSAFRAGLSRLNRWVNRVFLATQLRDVNWVKIYKRDSLASIALSLESSLVESEICAKLKLSGHSFVELPSRYLPRTSGVARGSSPRIAFQAVRDLWPLFLTVRRHKRSGSRAPRARSTAPGHSLEGGAR